MNEYQDDKSTPLIIKSNKEITLNSKGRIKDCSNSLVENQQLYKTSGDQIIMYIYLIFSIYWIFCFLSFVFHYNFGVNSFTILIFILGAHGMYTSITNLIKSRNFVVRLIINQLYKLFV